MFKVVIPARYASTRLPAKPMADIAGQPMVARVAERAQASGAEEVIVATDHRLVVDALGASSGLRVLMTREDHLSGTDRLAEVVDQLAWPDETIVVNVQGDEPLIDPRLIARVAAELEHDTEAAMATAAYPITSAAEFFNPNAVKVVCDNRGYAHYFSRAPIPYARDAFSAGVSISTDTPNTQSLPEDFSALRHVGLYAYRAGFLRRYHSLTPAPTERWESLEQLRALWHGFSIRVMVIDSAPEAGVDTFEDLERVRQYFQTCA